MIYVKLKTVIKKHPSGQVLRLPTDDTGVVLDQFWRRRVKDSDTDGCLEVLKKKPTKGLILNA